MQLNISEYNNKEYVLKHSTIIGITESLAFKLMLIRNNISRLILVII